jgi:hypothetical protein
MSAPMGVRIVRILPPDEWKKRQINTLQSVGQTNYSQGISMPKKDPIQAGIEAEDLYAARIRNAIDKRLRALGLSATNVQEWYKYASQLGANKLVDGVVKREAKVGDFVGKWVPILSDHVSKLDAMKVTTDAEAEQKMLANLRGLKSLHGAVKGAPRV